jgi:hypothetical protein
MATRPTKRARRVPADLATSYITGVVGVDSYTFKQNPVDRVNFYYVPSNNRMPGCSPCADETNCLRLLDAVQAQARDATHIIVGTDSMLAQVGISFEPEPGVPVSTQHPVVVRDDGLWIVFIPDEFQSTLMSHVGGYPPLARPLKVATAEVLMHMKTVHVRPRDFQFMPIEDWQQRMEQIIEWDTANDYDATRNIKQQYLPLYTICVFYRLLFWHLRVPNERNFLPDILRNHYAYRLHVVVPEWLSHPMKTVFANDEVLRHSEPGNTVHRACVNAGTLAQEGGELRTLVARPVVSDTSVTFVDRLHWFATYRLRGGAPDDRLTFYFVPDAKSHPGCVPCTRDVQCLSVLAYIERLVEQSAADAVATMHIVLMDDRISRVLGAQRGEGPIGAALRAGRNTRGSNLAVYVMGPEFAAACALTPDEQERREKYSDIVHRKMQTVFPASGLMDTNSASVLYDLGRYMQRDILSSHLANPAPGTVEDMARDVRTVFFRMLLYSLRFRYAWSLRDTWFEDAPAFHVHVVESSELLPHVQWIFRMDDLELSRSAQLEESQKQPYNTGCMNVVRGTQQGIPRDVTIKQPGHRPVDQPLLFSKQPTHLIRAFANDFGFGSREEGWKT